MEEGIGRQTQREGSMRRMPPFAAGFEEREKGGQEPRASNLQSVQSLEDGKGEKMGPPLQPPEGHTSGRTA